MLRVIQRAKESHLTLNNNKAKSKLAQLHVKYMGYIISSKGLSPDPENIQAIVKMSVPRNRQALQRLMGIINYVGSLFRTYLPLIPLYGNCLKKVAGIWDERHEEYLRKIKKALIESSVRKFYHLNKPHFS